MANLDKGTLGNKIPDLWDLRAVRLKNQVQVEWIWSNLDCTYTEYAIKP